MAWRLGNLGNYTQIDLKRIGMMLILQSLASQFDFRPIGIRYYLSR